MYSIELKLDIQKLFSYMLHGFIIKQNMKQGNVDWKSALPLDTYLYSRRTGRLEHFFSLNQNRHQTSCASESVYGFRLAFAGHFLSVHLKKRQPKRTSVVANFFFIGRSKYFTSWLFTVVAEGLDSRRTFKNFQIVVKTGLEPAPSGFQVRAQNSWLRYLRVLNFLNILLLKVHTPDKRLNWIFSLPVSLGCFNTRPLKVTHLHNLIASF